MNNNVKSILESLSETRRNYVNESTTDFEDFYKKNEKLFHMCEMPEELCDPSELLILKASVYSSNKLVLKDWNAESINNKLMTLACKKSGVSKPDVIATVKSNTGGRPPQKVNNGIDPDYILKASCYAIDVVLKRSDEWADMTFMILGKQGIEIDKTKGMQLKYIESQGSLRSDPKAKVKNVLMIARGIYQAYLRICGVILYNQGQGVAVVRDTTPVKVDVLQKVKVECPNCGKIFFFAPKCPECDQMIDYGITKDFYVK